MMHATVEEDEIVRGTDVDALSSRFSCYLKGYLPQDIQLPKLVPLVVKFKLLCEDSQFKRFALARRLRKSFFNLIDLRSNQPKLVNSDSKFHVLKSPVINRGTWLRTIAVNIVIKDFIHQTQNERIQIVSLGAGNDTRAFQLLPTNHNNLTYYELDFEQSCKVKKFSILSDSILAKSLGITTSNDPLEFQSSSSSGKLDSPYYHLIPCDLRDLNNLKQNFPSDFDWNAKTLILSECCICYMDTKESNNLLQFFKNNLKQGMFLIYDPIGGETSHDSRYGEVMVHNLKTRGIEMPNLMVYNTIPKQRNRFLQIGIKPEQLVTCDLKYVYHNWIDEKEINRISKLEMLDEIEELDLINSHYSLVVGWWGFSFEFKHGKEFM